MAPTIPIACNLDALSPPRKHCRSWLAARIRESVVATRETETGYRLHLKSETSLHQDALELISLERRCCPLLELSLVFSPVDGPVYMEVGGGAEVKAVPKSNGVLGCGR